MEEPSITLITGPDHAKKLLGTGEENKGNALDYIDEKTLTDLYLDEPSHSLVVDRKFSQLPAIKTLINFCEDNLDETTDPIQKIRNTVKFLAKLGRVDTSKIAFEAALRKFLSFYFHEDDSKKSISVLCERCIERVGADNVELLTPSTADVKRLKGTLNRAKFSFSLWLNESKPNYNQVSPHIWLSKIPHLSFEKELIEKAKPALVISAVHPSEYKTRRDKISSPLLWSEHGTPQIYLSKFIDFGRPYREAEFGKYENPETKMPFKNKQEWNDYLDALYTDIYYAVRLTEAEVTQNHNVIVHCKAGKGRSVMALAAYYYFNPQELDITLTDNVEDNINKIWEEMLAKRSHIDKDDKSKWAVKDCAMFVLANRKELDKKSILDIKKYFNRATETKMHSIQPSLDSKKEAQQ